MLTISLYAYSFGPYVSFTFHSGALWIRGLAAGHGGGPDFSEPARRREAHQGRGSQLYWMVSTEVFGFWGDLDQVLGCRPSGSMLPHPWLSE